MGKLIRCTLHSPATCEHKRFVCDSALCGYPHKSCDYMKSIQEIYVIQDIKDICVCVDMNNNERIQEIQRIITTYEKESA